MTRRLILVRHGHDPDDDRVFTWAQANGMTPQVVKPFAGETIPDIDGSVAGICIYGGGFNAYAHDEHPFLREEDRLIGTALARDLPLLGICQGAQQIAHHLGAPVGAPEHGQHEFGYYEIEPVAGGEDVLPAPLTVTQAHFHTFGIPDSAVRLARSATFENQAFRYGDKTFALQFHPEVTIPGFRRWQAAPWANYGKPGAQTRAEQDALIDAADGPQHIWFTGLLDRLFATA